MMGPKIHEWLNFYNLKPRLAFGPELNSGEVLANDQVRRKEGHHLDDLLILTSAMTGNVQVLLHLCWGSFLLRGTRCS